jgi:DNA-binding PadR family transcriptional regulator
MWDYVPYGTTADTFDRKNYACEMETLYKLTQPAILVVLAKGPLHGYRLAKRIGQMRMFDRQQPDVSGIYRFLKVMESQGLVVASWSVGERGPAKKSYRLTRAGEQCLKRWIQTLEDHRRSLNACCARRVPSPPA